MSRNFTCLSSQLCWETPGLSSVRQAAQTLTLQACWSETQLVSVCRDLLLFFSILIHLHTQKPKNIQGVWWHCQVKLCGSVITCHDKQNSCRKKSGLTFRWHQSELSEPSLGECSPRSSSNLRAISSPTVPKVGHHPHPAPWLKPLPAHVAD